MNIKVFKVWLYNVFFVIFVLKSVVNFSMGCCKFATINIRYVKKRFCSVSNFDNEKGFIAKFSGMKKYAAPVVLFVLACALIVYLKVDFSGSSSSFDVSRYMQTRAKIDSLEVALWNSQGNVDAQVKRRKCGRLLWWRLALDYRRNACRAPLLRGSCARAYPP